jgi:acyl-coenzyme A synthetase/AMP-(fatty) acid ligase
MKTGAICTFENHTLPYDILRANIGNTGADLVLVDERVFTEADRLTDDIDTIEAVVGFGEGKNPLLQDVTPNYAGDLHPVPQTHEDVAIINYTAGTTGRPKGVKLTHGTLESSVRAIMEAYHGVTSEDTMLLFMLMYHTGGISSSLFSVSAGATHVITGGWDPQRVMELTRTYDPTWYTYIVPMMARDLMSQDGWEEFDVSGIRSYVAGEPVPADLQEALQDAGMRVSGTYGMTETMPLTVTISPITQDADREMPPVRWGSPRGNSARSRSSTSIPARSSPSPTRRERSASGATTSCPAITTTPGAPTGPSTRTAGSTRTTWATSTRTAISTSPAAPTT